MDTDEYNYEPDIPLVRADYPVLAQMAVGMAVGLILSPYAKGIVYVLAFLIIYEILIYAVTHGKKPYWNWWDRAGIAASYLLGWLIGRILAGWQDPFATYPFEIRSPTLTAADPFGVKTELNIVTPQRHSVGTITEFDDIKNYNIRF